MKINGNYLQIKFIRIISFETELIPKIKSFKKVFDSR